MMSVTAFSADDGWLAASRALACHHHARRPARHLPYLDHSASAAEIVMIDGVQTKHEQLI